jgi:hypothetical protein
LSIVFGQQAALHGLERPDPLPYGLDIGTQDGKRLNIEWSDERVHIVSYKRGNGKAN